MTHPMDELDLHLYVDGHLDEERRRAIEAQLRHDSDMASRASEYRRQNDLMRQLFAALGETPLSDRQRRLMCALEERLGRSRLWANWRPAAAVVAGLLLAGGLGAAGTAFYDERTTPAVEEASSFAETAARVHTFYAGVSSEPTEFGADAAGKLRVLLDKRLGAPFGLPDLSAKGFSLVRGRLLPAPEGAAAQLLYRDQGGRLLTVFLGPVDQARFAPGAPTERQGLSLYAWHDGRIGIAVVGGMSGDELRGLAEAAQHSLQPPPQERRPDDRSGAQDPHGASRT